MLCHYSSKELLQEQAERQLRSQLKAEELMRRLRDNDQNLTSLTVSYPFGLNAFATSLIRNTVLTSLIFHNSFSDRGIEFLSLNSTLASLDLSVNSQIDGDSAAKGLSLNRTLTRLNLRGNKMTSEGAKALSLIPTLIWLDLSECNEIGDEGAKALSLITTLTWLDLSNNTWVGDEGAKALSLNPTLVTLDLGNDNVGDEGARALSLNTTITKLRLFDNAIENEGARALSLNTILTSLDLGCNIIGDEGARALSLNTTLTSLVLGYGNEIGDEGVKAFIDNTTLTKLDCREWVEDPHAEDIVEALAHAEDIVEALENTINNNLREKMRREATLVQQTMVIAQGAKQPNNQLRRLPRDLILHILTIAAKEQNFRGRTRHGIDSMLRLTLSNMDQRNPPNEPLKTWQTHYFSNKNGRQQQVEVFKLSANFLLFTPKRHREDEGDDGNYEQALASSKRPREIKM